MISQYFSSIEGIGSFASITTVIGIVGFLVSVIWALRRKKNYLSRMAELPLEGNIQETINKAQS